jgi:hypothetical protein
MTNSHLYHPIPYTRYPQGPKLAIGLRDVHAAHRLGSIGLVLELPLNIIEKRFHATFPFLYRTDGYPIHARCPLARPHLSPRRLKHITAIDSVIQGINRN